MFVLTCVFLILMLLGALLVLKHTSATGKTIRGLRKEVEMLQATNSYLTDKVALTERYRLLERDEHLKTIGLLDQLERRRR